ncbi:MAG: hypothetical protein M1167_06790 [Chloroflexi bacterium]|nr:hypothetical protein [Chloroflexota bacterium]MCL5949559.1 hypothetical protein [Candidatus Bathyarchaeota archaeon]
MVYKKARRKRSKGLIIMLLPVLIFIGVIGWCMYALDKRNSKPARRKPTRQRPARKDNVTLTPITFEEQHEIRMRNATSNR